MIEWFQEVFSSPSAKAQFVAILVSAVVAILALLLNQWFTNKRERKKVLTEKIEEMYLSSIDYVNAANKIIEDLSHSDRSDSNGYYEVDQVVYGNMNDSIRKMEMLCGLYFPEVDFKISDYTIVNMPLVETLIKGKQLSKGETFALYKESRDHINAAEKKLAKLCRKLMQDSMV
jgi:hypothetical protein